MPPKAPVFSPDALHGHVNTPDPVQFGCVYCLGEGLTAPAEHHIAYLWQGTSMCGKHFQEKVMGQ